MLQYEPHYHQIDSFYILGQGWPSFQVYWLHSEVQILFGIAEISRPLRFNLRAVLCVVLCFEASLAQSKPPILKNMPLSLLLVGNYHSPYALRME
jgi:hypothetical protein